MSARLAWGLAAALAVLGGCARWELVRPAAVAAGQVRLEGQRTRFTAPPAPPLVVDVQQVQYPLALGWNARERQWQQIDLAHVGSIEVREADSGATAGIVIASVVGGLTLVALVVYGLVVFLSGMGGLGGR